MRRLRGLVVAARLPSMTAAEMLRGELLLEGVRLMEERDAY